MNPGDPSLSVAKVYHAYDGGNQVLADVNLALAPGGNALIVGDNGSGKSTLGRLLAGLERPTSGRILVNGLDPAALPPARRCLHVSMMGQVTHLSVLSSSIFEEGVTYAKNRSPEGVEQSYLGWAGANHLPKDTSINPRDLSTPDLWRLILGLNVVILQPALLIIDEVFCAGHSFQMAALEHALDLRKKNGLTTIVLYQRELAVGFDATYCLQDHRLSAASL